MKNSDFYSAMSGLQSGASKGKIAYDPAYWEYVEIPYSDWITIRILPIPKFSYREHRKNRPGKNFPITLRCTVDSELTNGRCIGCNYATEYGKEVDPAKKITTATVEVFTILNLTKAHIRKEAGKKPEIKLCVGERCPACKSGLVSEYIGRRYWKIGYTHSNKIFSTGLKMGDRCKSCKTGEIKTLNMVCKKCGEPLLNDSQLSMPQEELKKLSYINMLCPSCQHDGFPKEEISCTDCESPVRTSLFDTNIKVKRVKTQEGGSGASVILEMEPTYKYEAIPEKFSNVETYDFNKIFPLHNLDVQSALFRVKNPWGVSKDIATEDGEVDVRGMVEE